MDQSRRKGSGMAVKRRAKAATAKAGRPPLLLWLVDDTSDHHHVADATVEPFSGVVIEHFYTGVEAVETYQLRARQAGRLPDVVLMDYYLNGERGDQVTRQLRAVEAPRHRPVVVGYSSVPSCSAAIVNAGGDVSVRKVASGMVNPYLSDYLQGLLAVRS